MDKECDKECYIRYRGRTWEPATTYHRHALSLYKELQGDKYMRKTDPIHICTTRYDGSMFMGNFRKKNSAIYVFQEIGINGEESDEVEIMFCSISLPSSLSRP
jgi:hypothetical protein